MLRYTRRAGLLPLTFAVALTVAAGLSLAEEHGWPQAEAPAATWQPAAAPHASGAERNIEGAPVRHGAAHAIGVGSRAINGDEPQDQPADPRH